MLDKASILKEAQKYLAKGAVDKAISELEKLVKESPDGNIFNMIGDIYLKKGAQKAAIDYYLKAANFFRQEGFSQKAQALYKKVLNINPVDTDALYAFGEISEEKGLVTDAIKYYLATSDLLVKEGKKEKILGIYEKILSLSPANVPLRIKVADIFIREGLKSDASREYLHIARMYDEKGDHARAKEFFLKTIDIQPLNREAALGLNYIYEKTGDIQQAMEQMKEATVLFPADMDILFRCSDMALRTKNTKLAVDCLQRITEKDPNNLRARRILGEFYANSGEAEKAWEQYLPVLDDLLSVMNYGDAVNLVASFRNIDPVQTGKRLVTLYRQNGDNSQAAGELIALCDLYAEQGLYEDAKTCLSDAAETDPDNPEVKRRTAPAEPAQAEPMAAEIEIPDLGIFDLSAEAEPSAFDMPEEPQAPEQFEAPGTADAAQITVRGEKTYDEVMTEADIFSRYGLLNEAQRLLEGLKMRFPENIDVHLRLKSLYADLHDRESAVTECIMLNELYKRRGETENAEQSLRDGYEINPEDPRLADRGFAHLIEQTSYASSGPSGWTEEAPKGHDIEDYEEELAEADFYTRQGLATEAVKILERLQKIFPENSEVSDRLHALGHSTAAEEEGETQYSIEMPETFDLSEVKAGIEGFEAPPEIKGQEGFGAEDEGASVQLDLHEEDHSIGEFEKFMETESPVWQLPVEKDMPAAEAGQGDKTLSGQKPEPEAPEKEPEFEDFSITEQDLTEAQEMPEPSLDNDVLEIFQEFKKGLEKELGDEDSETHYNLGIAYKEMGLVDDAIKEFQTSRNDPKRFIPSSTMLGVCYMEKGLYSLAIDVLNKALAEIKEKDEAYWAISYDLGEAQEKSGNLKEALEIYTEVYGWNAKFRSVSDKMSLLRAQIPKVAEPAKEKTRERKDRVSYL